MGRMNKEVVVVNVFKASAGKDETFWNKWKLLHIF